MKKNLSTYRNNKEIDLEILLKIFWYEKLKVILIVLTSISIAIGYNYLKPQKFKITLNLQKKTSFSLNKYTILNYIINTSNFKGEKPFVFEEIIFKNLHNQINKKLSSNSDLKKNKIILKKLKNFSAKKQQEIFDDFKYIKRKNKYSISLKHSNEREGKIFLNYFILEIFEKIKNSTIQDLNIYLDKHEKIYLFKKEKFNTKMDLIRNNDLPYLEIYREELLNYLETIRKDDVGNWFSYDEKKIYSNRLDNFKINTIIGILIGFLFSLIYVISFTKYKFIKPTKKIKFL